MVKRAKDVGDARQVERVELLTELEQRQKAENLRMILSSSGGREFLGRVLDFCGIYFGAPTDPHEMARYEGRRDVGLFIRNECLTVDADAYNLLKSSIRQHIADQEGEE